MKRRISRRFQPTMTPGLDQLESRQLLSSGFQVVTSPTVTGSDLSAVSAVSPTDIWAVGSDSDRSADRELQRHELVGGRRARGQRWYALRA